MCFSKLSHERIWTPNKSFQIHEVQLLYYEMLKNSFQTDPADVLREKLRVW